MLREIGRDADEESITEMIWEVDGNGEGYLGLDGFVEIINR
jgi:Ca2+-binding EF-hand superfamily protein